MLSTDLGLIQHLAYVLQLSLGVVFLLAAIPKLLRPRGFAFTVAGYRLLPRVAALALAPVVIAIESFVALSLLTGRLTAIALPLAMASLVTFSVAVAINLGRGRRGPCGCFGNQGEQISSRSLARLSVLMIAVGLLIASSVPPLTVSAIAQLGLSALPLVVQLGAAGAFAILAGIWLLSIPELAFILRALGPAQRIGLSGRLREGS